MTTADRLTRHPRFEWRAGMVLVRTRRDRSVRTHIIAAPAPGIVRIAGALTCDRDDIHWLMRDGWTLDLDHPATQGVLYAWLREDWPDAVLYPPRLLDRYHGDWLAFDPTGGARVRGPTPGAALALARLTAWGEVENG
jgi:hypothetical protein